MANGQPPRQAREGHPEVRQPYPTVRAHPNASRVDVSVDDAERQARLIRARVRVVQGHRDFRTSSSSRARVRRSFSVRSTTCGRGMHLSTTQAPRHCGVRVWAKGVSPFVKRTTPPARRESGGVDMGGKLQVPAQEGFAQRQARKFLSLEVKRRDPILQKGFTLPEGTTASARRRRPQ